MNIKKGQHIRCIFYNNMMIEGIVENWSDEESILNSLDGQSQLIISHSSKDIMMIKVILSKKITLPEPALKKEFEQTLKEPVNDLRNKRLADLKIMLINQEKEIVQSKLNDHHIGEVRTTKYEAPGFLTQPSIKQHPKK